MSKRITILTVALLVAISGVAVAQTAAEAKAPRLTVVEPIKDFGTVAKGQKLNWTFTVKNTGTADLEILAARPACGCTVAEFDKVIKPGQSGKVVSAVDTASFSGPIAKTIALETNDPAAPNAQLTMSAIVKPYVDFHPAGFVRFNLLQGDVEAQSVTLYSAETEPFQITKVETPYEWIKVDYKKLDEPIAGFGKEGQNQYRLIFTVGGPDARVGPLAEKVKVMTTSKHQPEVLVSVTGVIRPTYRVQPSGVNFGEVTPAAKEAKRAVTLKSLSLKEPEAFVVTKAETNIPGVTAAVEPTGNKGEYRVTLQVANNAKEGNIEGALKIYTSDKVKPVTTIPVKGVVKNAS